VGTAAKPHTIFRRAIERGSLMQAEMAAREVGRLSLEDSLSLVLLMLSERDARYETAAVRWWGLALAAHPHIGLELAAEGADALAELGGASPDVARSRLAFILRSGGAVHAAKRLEAVTPR
jgi:hypothetical protein